jgi:hypothetical protein
MRTCDFIQQTSECKRIVRGAAGSGIAMTVNGTACATFEYNGRSYDGCVVYDGDSQCQVAGNMCVTARSVKPDSLYGVLV